MCGGANNMNNLSDDYNHQNIPHFDESTRTASRRKAEKYQSACRSFMPNERIAESIVVAAAQAFKSFFFSSR